MKHIKLRKFCGKYPSFHPQNFSINPFPQSPLRKIEFSSQHELIISHIAFSEGLVNQTPKSCAVKEIRNGNNFGTKNEKDE